MNIKNLFLKNKSEPGFSRDWKRIGARLGCFLLKKGRFFVFLAMFVMTGYCLYVWYGYVYNPHWSQERKEAYLKEKDRGEVFRKSQFDAVVSEFKRRKIEKNKSLGISEDIFRLNQ